MEFSMDFLSKLFSIVIIDLVLAGDNAVVIALASRNLPPEMRNKAIYLGTFGAIIIRTVMTLFAVWLLTIPYLQAIGGLVLIPVALKLLRHEDVGDNIQSSTTFWGAIKTIIIADAVMGIDNVLAIAGAAHGSFTLVVLGLIISVPIIVWGSKWIGALMEKYPPLVYAGAGILAWTAGTMIMSDKIVGPYLTNIASIASLALPALITMLVLCKGYISAKKTVSKV